MSRKKTNPAESLSRFMYGIFDYYYDKGMPAKTAKARMIDNTMEECAKIIRTENEIPDQMTVLMAIWMSKTLQSRGMQITKEIEAKYPKGTPVPEEAVQPLRDLKEAKDAIDQFIESYKGWGNDE